MTPKNMRPVLLVSRFDECLRFYRDTMGFKVIWGKEGDSYATFIVRRSFHLSIFDKGQMAKAIGNDSMPHEVPSQDDFALTFEVGDLEKTVKNLEGKGAKFVTSIIDRNDWGIRTIFLRDPDGNLLQLESGMPKEQWTPELQEESKVYRPDS
jgi:catechol 2,3-dioxygenase-like lactoylglutathione lyase family enzyme